MTTFYLKKIHHFSLFLSHVAKTSHRAALWPLVMLLCPRELAWLRSPASPDHQIQRTLFQAFTDLTFLDFDIVWNFLLLKLYFLWLLCQVWPFPHLPALKYLCSWSMCILPKTVPWIRRQDIVMPKSLNSGMRLPRLESWLFPLDRFLRLLMPQFCPGKMGMLLAVSHSVVVKIRWFNIHDVPRIVPGKWQMLCKSLLWERGKKIVGEREREREREREFFG